ncbi:MAG: hypothetical protein RIT81_43095 [Deltaproteobacteria bacterium]
MLRLVIVLLFAGLTACGDSEPDFNDLFEQATTVEACESPTRMCEADARGADCGGEEACENQALAECQRLRSMCRWRIEQPNEAFPCPDQVCGEACTKLDDSSGVCNSRFECADAASCI